MAQWSEELAGQKIRRADADKSASDEIYREAVEIVFPDRENWTKQKEGTDRNSGLSWDSTPQVSLIRSANRLSSDFTPQFTPFVEIGLGPAAEAMPDEAFQEATGRTKEDFKRELENTTKVVQAIYQGPGFATSANELYIDFHFGQGGMTIMPTEPDAAADAGPITFEAMPISHFYAYAGPNGRHDQWFFWHEIRADAITAQWQDAKLTAELQEMAKPEAKKNIAKLVSVCYRDYADKVYRYEVFHKHGHKMSRIVERQTRSSAFITPRHTKLPGENRGRGPVTFALPDIRTANKIVELTLRAAAIAVGGVYTAEDSGVLSPVRIKPLSIIRVRSNGGAGKGPSLQRLDTPQRIDFGEVLLEQLHLNIRKVIGDHSLPPESDPIRTATEFVQRARELVADQAGGLGRLFGEFIVPATQRIVDILEQQQLLTTDQLKIDGFLVEVRMLSPLAKSEAMGEVENIVRFIEILMTMFAEQGPQMVGMEMDLPKTTGHLGDLLNVPMSIRNTEAVKQEAVKQGTRAIAEEAGGDPDAAEAALAQVELANE